MKLHSHASDSSPNNPSCQSIVWTGLCRTIHTYLYLTHLGDVNLESLPYTNGMVNYYEMFGVDNDYITQ